MTFGETALRLAGLAARMLGWRPDDFWRATPAELFAALVPHDAATFDRAMLDRLMEMEHGR